MPQHILQPVAAGTPSHAPAKTGHGLKNAPSCSCSYSCSCSENQGAPRPLSRFTFHASRFAAPLLIAALLLAARLG
ncbi:MAG TPA: hypothetical protein VFU47_14760, partial [Armatimonadota bacterium]|nr:hypothetical protein [Armatimonadota bacterium]